MQSRTALGTRVVSVTATSRARQMTKQAEFQRPFQPAPEIRDYLKAMNALGNDLDNLTQQNLLGIRLEREQLAARSLWHIPVESVRSFTVHSNGCAVPVRCYVPHEKQLLCGGRLPVVVFFHGGGWTLGSAHIYDSVTRELARRVPALVLSVDYRLAPEHPFPAAVEDANAVVQWVRRRAGQIGGDPARVVLVGDSGGGTLATVAAMHARRHAGPPILMEVLFYPSVNISSTEYDSFQEYGEGHLLTKRAVESFRQFYLPRACDWASPNASPLLARNLSGMPLTLIIGAGCDPLRDEGQIYAQKLRAQEVEVLYHLESGLIHSFLNLYNLCPECSAYAEGVLAYAAGVIREQMMGQLHRELNTSYPDGEPLQKGRYVPNQ